MGINVLKPNVSIYGKTCAELDEMERRGEIEFTPLIGRDELPRDKEAFDLLERAFAPAKDAPFTVWGEWTKWINIRQRRWRTEQKK